MEINIKPCKISTSFKTEKIYPKLEELEVTPSVEEQKYKGAYGVVTVRGVTAEIDDNIKEEYIKEGVNILGVDGGYKGVDTSDVTATPEDILAGKTAYANNEKIEGTIQEYDGSFEGNTAEELKITDASFLFYDGARLEIINELLRLCKNIISTASMFHNSSSKLIELDLSKLDTSYVTSMASMFNSCGHLKELDISNFNTSNVKLISSMFSNCSQLQELDLSNFDTSNINSMYNLFYYCSQLKNLNLSSFDMNTVTNTSGMFNYCSNLTNLKSFKSLGKGYNKTTINYSNYKLDLNYCKLLTYESLLDVLTNGLYDLNLSYDVANGGTLYTQSLTLGSTNLAKLTAEEIAIATNKGWTVS